MRSATARPACSINAMPGTPPAMISRSTSDISALVRSSIMAGDSIDGSVPRQCTDATRILLVASANSYGCFRLGQTAYFLIRVGFRGSGAARLSRLNELKNDDYPGT